MPCSLKYGPEFLCPTLHPGDIVIADNLRSHRQESKRPGSGGGPPRYLLSYPDLNPIENCLPNSKRCPQKPPMRTVDVL